MVDAAAGLAMRASAAAARAWRAESVAPKAAVAATRPAPAVMGGSAIPRPLDWANKAEMASGIVRQQGSALPVSAVPVAVVDGSALPRDARPPYVVDEARKQAALAKATRARQAEDQTLHQSQAHQEELQL